MSVQSSPRRPKQVKSPKQQMEELQAQIPPIFDSVQTSSNSKPNMLRHSVQLWKIHDQLSLFQTFSKVTRQPIEAGEKRFLETFQEMLVRVFIVKKTVPAADRVVCFLGWYMEYIHEKVNEDGEQPSDEETTASRFTDQILEWLMKGFNAKDKNVRSGVLKAVSKMLPTLGVIDEDLYESLEESFVDRINDKDVSVRESAASCLARLVKCDPEANLEENESVALLLDTMAHDPAADVRKAIVKDIPLKAETTLVAFLERTRDTDPSVRKVVYEVLQENITEKVVKAGKTFIVKGPTHPDVLSIEKKELIVEHGLKDRAPQVRAAAEALLWEWYGSEHKVKLEEQDEGVKIEEQPTDTGVGSGLSFIQLFKVATHPESAEEALASIFKTHSVFARTIRLPGRFWAEVTVEKVFFVRMLVKHFADKKKALEKLATSENETPAQKAASDEVSQCEDRIDELLPEVMRIVTHIYQGYMALQDLQDDDQQKERRKTTTLLVQLLQLALFLDYSDEVGRRKMHSLMRDFLADLYLPDELMPHCMEVLRQLSNDERDFIRLVVENIKELRTPIDELEDPPKDVAEEDSAGTLGAASQQTRVALTSERREQIDGNCLAKCVSMLKLVDEPVENNSTLDYVIHRLIKPSLEQPHMSMLALEAMSLCALTSEVEAKLILHIAKENIVMPRAPTRLKIMLYQLLFDIYMVYKIKFFRDEPEDLKSIPDFILERMTIERLPEVKAVLAHGMTKFVAMQLVSSDEAYITLVKFYISPFNSGNQKLQQCLAYFFGEYPKRSSFYQERLAKIFVHVFLDFCEDLKKMGEEEEEEIVTFPSAKVADMFFEWTDPSFLLERQDSQDVNVFTHLDIAESIVKVLFEKDLKVEIEKEDKRVLCRLLDKLYLPEKVDDYRIRSLHILLDKLKTLRPIKDSVCKKAVNKFTESIEKRFSEQLQGISEDELRLLEDHNDLFAFLDSIIPLDDDEEEEFKPVIQKGKKRRSDSVLTSPPGSRSQSPGPSNTRTTRSRTKRPRLSDPDPIEEDKDSLFDGSSRQSTPVVPVKRPRAPPKRAPAALTSQQNEPEVIVISSDSDEEAPPPPKRTAKKSQPRPRTSVQHVKQEASLDGATLDRSTAGPSVGRTEVSYDSIMDSEDEEEEVSEILADD